MTEVLERIAVTAASGLPTAADRRRVDQLVARARREAAMPIDDTAFSPEVLRWLPVAVPGLAVLMCLSILVIWSIL